MLSLTAENRDCCCLCNCTECIKGETVVEEEVKDCGERASSSRDDDVGEKWLWPDTDVIDVVAGDGYGTALLERTSSTTYDSRAVAGINGDGDEMDEAGIAER